ncbi:hypothetical protein BTH42_05890 [Burkholderia sp. SRS-W-2-2016]|uniref:GNAT family N-acetyltransferase n=1 Tax=Burkholderia sp. SRS-W-2-2016 TaxID=1926878 RepID=UPI00094B08B4|nr:GNAT family N-acetyltransferase [Burkholderia sp. SRS-W-2-2016]OLL32551.1 hypothetical protein BTH42_05890 [Burkholderia sp. SRS-W-2-2016]
MNDTSVAYEIVCNEADFHALQPEWDALWSRARGRYYQSFGTCWQAWEQIAKPLGKKLRIVVRRELGHVVLIFPLVSHRRALWTYLMPLGSESADFTSMLVDDDAATLARVADTWQVMRTRCRADFITMPNVRDSTPLYRLTQNQRRFVVKEQAPHYVAKLDEESRRYDWQSFCDSLGTLKGNKPGRLGKLGRRLATVGTVRVDVVDSADPARFVALIDTLLDWKRGWKHDWKRGLDARVGKHGHWLESRHYRNFLAAWVSAESTAVRPLAFVVGVDGTPVAIDLICADSRGVTGIIASFDPAFAKWSPGVLAFEAIAKWAFDNQLPFELGVGAEAYKPYWSRGNRGDCCTTQSVNSWWGLAAWCARRWPRAALTRVRAVAGSATALAARRQERAE